MVELQLNLPLGLPPGSPIWDPAVLETLAELNGQMLSTLSGAVRSNAGQPAAAPLLSELADCWSGLDAPASALLAAGPMLLIDAGLADPSHWRAGIPGVQDVVRPAGCNPYFHSAEGVALMRRVLVLAWHLARANPLVGRVVLGMTAGCAMRLACCRLRDLEVLAEQLPDWITPRWQDQPQIWRQMLEAAARADLPLMQQLRWRGVQLLAASLQAAGG